MARRVNTKFVFILALSVCAVGVSAAGVVFYGKYRTRDPKVLLAQAEAMEKSGDLVKAVAIYESAANAAHNAHALDADTLYAKWAAVSATVSAQAKTSEEADKYYGDSLKALQQALAENPRNREVNEKLMEERYQFALLDHSSASWSALEDLASRLIANEIAPSAKPLIYRAEAKLRQAQLLTTSETPESRLMEIEGDLKKAMELDPNAGKAVALKYELQWVRITQILKHGGGDDAQKRSDAAEKELSAFLKTHPNDADAVPMQIQVLLQRNTLARAIAQAKSEKPPQILPADSGKDLLAAIAVAKSAYAAHPGDMKLGGLLGRLYQLSEAPNVAAQPALTEKILQELIAAHPESAECYFALAQFYQNQRKLPEAVAAYAKCLEHTDVGGGIEAQKNANYQFESNNAIAWISMDLGEIDGLDTAKGAADLDESSKYALKVQNAHVNPGIAYLLSGRMHFLQGKLPEAAADLRSAEANIANLPGQDERMQQIWRLLAQTNILQQQPGAALDYYDKSLKASPGNGFIILQRAALLNQLARYSDAQSAMEDLLTYSASLPPEVVGQAKQILANSKAGLGKLGESQGLLGQMDSVGAMLQLASLNEDGGEYDAALVVLAKVFEKEPDNMTARRLATIAYVRLEKTAEASQMVEKALAKDPKNAEFQLWRGMLANPNDHSLAMQQKLIEGISDEYLKQMQLSVLFRQNRDSQKEVAALQAAESAIGDTKTLLGVQRQADIVERIFTAATVTAEIAADAASKDTDKEKAATDAAVRDKYWEIARNYVQKAENLNLDGVNGKFYRGRLEAMKSNGKTGIPLIEQAVALRPDYAFGHSILGQAYYTQERYDAALEEFRQAVHLVPTNVTFIRATIELLLRQPDPAKLQESCRICSRRD